MLTIGYVRVSTDRQAEQGVSLEAQEAKIRAMATVQGADLIDVIVDGGESAKSLNRPGLQRLMALVNGGKVQAVNRMDSSRYRNALSGFFRVGTGSRRLRRRAS
jgi:DNA invertase Pin-like site-specific DNA recombinase